MGSLKDILKKLSDFCVYLMSFKDESWFRIKRVPAAERQLPI